MLVHKGGKIKNWGGECRDVTPTKSLSQVFEKIKKKKNIFFFFFFLGGGVRGVGEVGGRIRVGGVRVDVNEELKFL